MIDVRQYVHFLTFIITKTSIAPISEEIIKSTKGIITTYPNKKNNSNRTLISSLKLIVILSSSEGFLFVFIILLINKIKLNKNINMIASFGTSLAFIIESVSTAI